MKSITGIVKDYSGGFPLSRVPLFIMIFVGAVIALYLGIK
ncbi:putative membrane protein [Acinetobacter sp. 1281984]|jgi:hypothetical protein|nr:putative membrane protein [Acinetobacter sp. 1245593]EXR28535.1 putative membrane protein [Acinetobacter sp. 1281984]SSR41270.1 transporter, anion:cation symporter (ACS) family [Acinetobacter baumannii]